MAEISDRLSKLDLQYSQTPSPAVYKKRLQLHSEYNLLLTHKVEKQLLSAKQHFFEFGEKAGKLLAFQSRTVRTSKLIPKIKSAKGDIVSDPEEIN